MYQFVCVDIIDCDVTALKVAVEVVLFSVLFILIKDYSNLKMGVGKNKNPEP